MHKFSVGYNRTGQKFFDTILPYAEDIDSYFFSPVWSTDVWRLDLQKELNDLAKLDTNGIEGNLLLNNESIDNDERRLIIATQVIGLKNLNITTVTVLSQQMIDELKPLFPNLKFHVSIHAMRTIETATDFLMKFKIKDVEAVNIDRDKLFDLPYIKEFKYLGIKTKAIANDACLYKRGEHMWGITDKLMCDKEDIHGGLCTQYCFRAFAEKQDEWLNLTRMSFTKDFTDLLEVLDIVKLSTRRASNKELKALLEQWTSTLPSTEFNYVKFKSTIPPRFIKQRLHNCTHDCLNCRFCERIYSNECMPNLGDVRDATLTGLRMNPDSTTQPLFLLEDGHMDLHLWVTYECPNKCPSCYLQALKNKAPDMKLEDVALLMQSIKEYRKDWNMFRVTMYGAEPQSKAASYYHKLMDIVLRSFPSAQFGMYTSLQYMNDEWIKLFKRIEKNNTLAMLAASYDGGMRGEKYNENLEASIHTMLDNGMRLGVMTVVNTFLVKEGAKSYVDFLERNKIQRFSLKPFIPIEGQMEKWTTFGTDMETFSYFAIAVHEELERRKLDVMSSTVGHICNENNASQNTGGYAIFVDGGMRAMYMGYRDGMEYLQEWGTIKDTNSFEEIVNNPVRKQFLRNQRMLNYRQDCAVCEHSGRCLAEVFKSNYDDSNECIGAKKFVNWAYNRYGALYESGC
jgi:sulfatase maturation enzyme AslB (radical SAM superfamily)